MSTKILLESGTNELQILEFNVGKNIYGINIAKVSEIMTDQEITPIPNGPDEVEGVFIPRDQLITVIDLHTVLHIPNPGGSKSVIIVCQFNKMQVAFHVTKVNGFQRISWTDIVEPPAVSSSEGMGISTGVAKINDRLIMILDFERIVSDLNKSSGLDVTGLTEIDKASINAGRKRVVVADDSPFLNKMITSTLSEMGLSNIASFQNGEDAWHYVSSFKDKDGPITDHVACVISDIEMPKMDGHRLTKLIKDDPVLRDIPVILFSSLIDEQMIHKCKAVGADAQFSKPQISDLIKTLLRLISE
ncbi:MAG: chemotaxis protein [Ruminococcus sp.]|nr:chemotaxis protein [Ruminococcus sp.]